MHINPPGLLPGNGKGPPMPPGPHNRQWPSNHADRHPGGAGGGFPMHGGDGKSGDIGRALPGPGLPDPRGPVAGIPNPGHGLPVPGAGIPHPGHGAPTPGAGIPNPGHGAPTPGAGIPHPGHGTAPPGAGMPTPGPGPVAPGPLPGQGLLHDLPGVTRPSQNAPPANAPHAHNHAPTHAGSQAVPLPLATPATFQQPAATPTAQAQLVTAQMTQMAQVPMAPLQAPHTQLAQAPVAHAMATAGQLAQAAHPAAPAQATQAPAQMARPDAVPAPRAEAPVGDRAALAQRALAGAVAMPANAAATQMAGASTLAAAGTTVATAAAASQMANPAQAIEARNVNPLIAGDRVQGGMARPEGAGTYTGDGPGRRGLRRAARALPGGLATLLTALGGQGATAAAARDAAAAERELRETVMQWLFWMLAIIAYGCIAFAVIGLLPPGTLGGGGSVGNGGRGWTGGFALAGLVAGLGAWWFARGIAPRGGKGDDA